MPRYRATLAYDGTAYQGYQIQANVPTIQGELEIALAKVFKEPIHSIAAGRTDTGVHATGQVVAFDAPWNHDDASLLRAINVYLPMDIALQDIRQQAGFHPRFDALSRTYRYQVAVVDVRQPLLAWRAWQVQDRLDDAAMQTAADLILGEHDFAAFGKPPQGENTVRKVFRAQWQQELSPLGKFHAFEIEATAYLHHMVRRIVGCLVQVGRKRLSIENFARLLKSRNLAQNKWIAPPQGLSLIDVRYPPAGLSRDAYLQVQGQDEERTSLR